MKNNFSTVTELQKAINTTENITENDKSLNLKCMEAGVNTCIYVNIL